MSETSKSFVFLDDLGIMFHRGWDEVVILLKIDKPISDKSNGIILISFRSNVVLPYSVTASVMFASSSVFCTMN
ncbi:MAG TPA: hypothetical protein EYP99_03595 [Candidatus Poseidoniales archaeon]|nr:hypothetical protein [Candidatus Poseidoniales archaeon]